MLEPTVPDNSDELEFLGDLLIISFSGGSMPRAKAGSESVMRFINSI